MFSGQVYHAGAHRTVLHRAGAQRWAASARRGPLVDDVDDPTIYLENGVMHDRFGLMAGSGPNSIAYKSFTKLT